MDAVIEIRHGKVRGSTVDGVPRVQGIPTRRRRSRQSLRPRSRCAVEWRARRAQPMARTPSRPIPGNSTPPPAGDLRAGRDCLTLISGPRFGSAGLPGMVWIPAGIAYHGPVRRPGMTAVVSPATASCA